MSGQACVEAWTADGTKNRTHTFDEKFPHCCCEVHSFSGKHSHLSPTELMARIITSPFSYDLDGKTIIWSKLVRIYSDGFSLFRAGCFESEVKQAVERAISGGAEPQTLVGAALITVGTVRNAGEPEKWFCVYDTVAEEFSEHADIAGTRPDLTLSNTQQRRQKESRMRTLRDLISETFIYAATAEELISRLRSSCFEIFPDI
jgi:hypothetical protein